jgi:hypothetical protein
LNDRWLRIARENWSNIDPRHGAKACGYIINEIKESDLYTGGKTRVSYIDYNGINDLTQDDISKIPQDFVKSFVELAPEMVKQPQAFIEIFMQSLSNQ